MTISTKDNTRDAVMLLELGISEDGYEFASDILYLGSLQWSNLWCDGYIPCGKTWRISGRGYYR